MMHRFVIPGYDKTAGGRKSLDREYSTLGAVSSTKRNRCVIFPATVNVVAEALERRNQALHVRAKVASDLIVQVGEYSFHLHKLPMVCRSGYLNRLVFQRRCIQEKDAGLTIRIENLPGGTEIFELVLKFCYGWKIALTATNIAPLYCAAQFLEMSDDLEPGNLISKAEAFLNFVIFSSWKETFLIFKSCESMSPWAKEFQVLKRCSEAIAWKACIDPETISSSNEDAQWWNFLENNTAKPQLEKVAESWWFEDVSFLRIDHFILVIDSIKGKGMIPELIGSCITHWTTRWLPRIAVGLDNLANNNLTHQVQRVTVDSLIRVIPAEENSVSCNFLLHLLKLGLTMKIDSEVLNKLERRLAFMLEQCRVADLLVKSYGNNATTIYDIGIIVRVVESYVSCVLRNPRSRIFAVGRLVDGYLTFVARDENLTAKTFQSLVEALPKSARYCDDNLYRAIDMYLKAHPSLTEEERSGICRVLEYHKLSQEARKHAVKNDRLPENITARFILLEQVNMTRSVTAVGSKYQITKTQAIIRVSRGLEKQWEKSQKEIRTMKEEVESIKMQLSKLKTCKVKLQKQMKRCIFFG